MSIVYRHKNLAIRKQRVEAGNFWTARIFFCINSCSSFCRREQWTLADSVAIIAWANVFQRHEQGWVGAQAQQLPLSFSTRVKVMVKKLSSGCLHQPPKRKLDNHVWMQFASWHVTVAPAQAQHGYKALQPTWLICVLSIRITSGDKHPYPTKLEEGMDWFDIQSVRVGGHSVLMVFSLSRMTKSSLFLSSTQHACCHIGALL